MIDDELAKRFGWWWRNPAKALRRQFPEKSSEEAIRKYVWPELERAALNYELASRANGRKKYLLGKPFDQLTQGQMGELAILWPRKPRPLQPVRFLPYAESPDVTATLRRLASEGSLVLSENPAGDADLLTQRVLKRSERTKAVETSYSRGTGWTVPQYVTFNLKECGDTAICKAFQKHVAAERKRLNIPAPIRNKGRANRSAGGLSFHRVETLDVWSLSPEKVEAIRATTKKTRDYDDGQMRLARRKAGILFREWAERRWPFRASLPQPGGIFSGRT